MSAKRVSLWTSSDSERYLNEAAQAAVDVAERQEGAHTARNLTAIWGELSPEERLLIEYMLMTGSTTCVAIHNDGLLDALVEKGMLQKPPGVGTVFMQYHDTTYDVPPAVWRTLNERRTDFLPSSSAEIERMKQSARTYLKDKVRVFEPARAAAASASAISKSK